MRRLLPLALAGLLGCAAPDARPGLVCPEGHEGVFEAHLWRDEGLGASEQEYRKQAAGREGRPVSTDTAPDRIFECGTCGYAYRNGAQVWSRSTTRPGDFRKPPNELLRGLARDFLDSDRIIYGRVVRPSSREDSVHGVSASSLEDVWSKVLARAAAAGVLPREGEAPVEGSKSLVGSLGPLEVRFQAFSRGGNQTSFHAEVVERLP
jgi:hypothetical protein